ncbi:hypothetical protein CHS0354_003718 [Potamilus streckersoni]|uniref:Uncharacterized protein n=1 Tax=Potamilus streckersoni TaxID=2493646 RepID=A0AAE0SSL4_9BIVA|nr:hypothetical protein CHS0354_003718 [Potamilus streckersoni]
MYVDNGKWGLPLQNIDNGKWGCPLQNMLRTQSGDAPYKTYVVGSMWGAYCVINDSRGMQIWAVLTVMKESGKKYFVN